MVHTNAPPSSAPEPPNRPRTNTNTKPRTAGAFLLRKNMHTQATPQQIQHLQQQVAALTSAVQLLARVKGERLTTAQVVERIGRTRQTIATMVRRGDFPPPCKDGHWLLSEIMEWEEKKR